MSVELQELVKQISPQQIKLLAGKNGIEASAEWAHMVENVEIASFMQTGEIAFTTGIGIHQGVDSIMDLTKSVFDRGGVAIIINIGPYITQVPQEVIDFGNANDFPVYEVPWEVHMSDIIRIFCETIIQSKQKAMEISAAFRNAIYAPKMEDLYVPLLMQKGYFSESQYVVGVIDISERITDDTKKMCYRNLSSERLDMMQKKIEHYIHRRKFDAVIYEDQEKILIILGDINEQGAYELIEGARADVQQYLRGSEVTFASVGHTTLNIRRMFKSYIVAHRIAELAKIQRQEYQTKSYSKMGVERLFLNLDDFAQLEDFCKDIIGPLEEYDTANNSNLIETLEVYMKNDGSVQSTAEEMFVHRNTINYKLKKIEGVLAVDLTDFGVRNQLMMALIAAKFRMLR